MSSSDTTSLPPGAAVHGDHQYHSHNAARGTHRTTTEETWQPPEESQTSFQNLISTRVGLLDPLHFSEMELPTSFPFSSPADEEGPLGSGFGDIWGRASASARKLKHLILFLSDRLDDDSFALHQRAHFEKRIMYQMVLEYILANGGLFLTAKEEGSSCWIMRDHAWAMRRLRVLFSNLRTTSMTPERSHTLEDLAQSELGRPTPGDLAAWEDLRTAILARLRATEEPSSSFGDRNSHGNMVEPTTPPTSPRPRNTRNSLTAASKSAIILPEKSFPTRKRFISLDDNSSSSMEQIIKIKVVMNQGAVKKKKQATLFARVVPAYLFERTGAKPMVESVLQVATPQSHCPTMSATTANPPVMVRPSMNLRRVSMDFDPPPSPGDKLGTSCPSLHHTADILPNYSFSRNLSHEISSVARLLEGEDIVETSVCSKNQDKLPSDPEGGTARSEKTKVTSLGPGGKSLQEHSRSAVTMTQSFEHANQVDILEHRMPASKNPTTVAEASNETTPIAHKRDLETPRVNGPPSGAVAATSEIPSKGSIPKGIIDSPVGGNLPERASPPAHHHDLEKSAQEKCTDTFPESMGMNQTHKVVMDCKEHPEDDVEKKLTDQITIESSPKEIVKSGQEAREIIVLGMSQKIEEQTSNAVPDSEASKKSADLDKKVSGTEQARESQAVDLDMPVGIQMTKDGALKQPQKAPNESTGKSSEHMVASRQTSPKKTTSIDNGHNKAPSTPENECARNPIPSVFWDLDGNKIAPDGDADELFNFANIDSLDGISTFMVTSPPKGTVVADMITDASSSIATSMHNMEEQPIDLFGEDVWHSLLPSSFSQDLF